MERFRISGLVRLAKSTRQELAGPISAERLDRLRRNVHSATRMIEGLLHQKGITLNDLPSPSKKAYQFLKDLNFDAITPCDTDSPNHFPPDSVSFRGLQSYLKDVLNQLGTVDSAVPTQSVYDSIASSSKNIEEQIRAKGIRPEQLKKNSRQIRGWVAYFSRRENLNSYCAAVQRAHPCFHQASPCAARPAASVRIHFCPMQGIYRIRRSQHSVLVQLPTPMICFERETFRSLSALALKKGRDRQPVLDATLAQPYQRIVSELELLGGVVAQAGGLYHDLAASFDRVNARYFNGGLDRPRLVWSRIFTVRKFGHYDHARDTVMVSMSLDGKAVPECAIDFIVYHELLHKVLGVTWKNNTMAVHTTEFMNRERAFQQYDDAKAVLKRLASER